MSEKRPCINIIDKLDEETKRLFFQHAKTVEIPKGNILFFQGDICPEILYLTSGNIRLYIQNEEGDEITLYTLQAYEQCIVNTSSVFSATPAIATAVTMNRCKGFLISTQAVRELMVHSQIYQEFMFSLFALRLNSLTLLLEEVRFSSLKERVLKWLASQHTQTIYITHEAIAQQLGSSRVVISRILKQLEKSGQLELARGKICISKA